LSEQTIFKVESGWRYDYWIMDEGVFRVTILALRLFYPMSLGLFVAAFIISYFLPTLLAFILVLGSIFASAPLAGLIAKRRRRRMSALEPRTITENQGLTKRFLWEEIRGVTLTRRRRVAIDVGFRRFTGTINESEAEQLKSFVLSKVGEKFQFRDGTF